MKLSIALAALATVAALGVTGCQTTTGGGSTTNSTINWAGISASVVNGVEAGCNVTPVLSTVTALVEAAYPTDPTLATVVGISNLAGKICAVVEASAAKSTVVQGSTVPAPVKVVVAGKSYTVDFQ